MTVIDNDMQPSPDLAKSVWAVPVTDPQLALTGEPYGSVWQYNLTENAMWHDGEPFTADDVVWNFKLNADNFYSMWAYQPYSYFMKDAEKINEQTVRVHFYDRATGDAMPASYAYLISIPMLPRHKLQDIDPFTIGFNWTGVFQGEDFPIVGTGPFTGTKNIRQEWLAGDHITLVTNKDYHWKADYGKEVQFDKLVMYFYDESTAMTYALENKQLDVAAFPPQAFKNIRRDVESGALKNITTFDGRKITQYWTEIGFNMNNDGPNPSRLDHDIRLAAAMATNKSYILQQYYLGEGEVGTTLIPPVNSWHYEPNATETIPYDIEGAKALLEAAGYVDINSDGIRECTSSSFAVHEGLVPESKPLVYDMMIRREFPEEKDIAMYLEEEWAKIGIDVNYRILDESQLGTEAYAYTYDTFIWYWSADIDPNYQLYVTTKSAWGGWNDNRWSNESYEENYTKSVQTLDPAQRRVYTDNCQRVHYLDIPYIILAYTYQTYAWRDDTFSGWGDWAADPGRSVDNFWMGNPLFMDLVPIGGQDSEIPWAYILVGVAVVAAVVVVLVLLKMKGKKKEGKIGESPLGD
jgi:peptide/nickel transport system substrate-binding protein